MSVPSVGSVALDLTANTGGFFKQIQSAGDTASSSLKNKIGGAFAAIGKIAATAISVKAITAFTKGCIEAASDLAEVQNVVDVTFKNNAETINAWAKTTQKSYGLSELAAKQYSGTMGAMLKSMNLSSESVLDMSMNISALAGDMASFYNLDTDTAFEKIRSGISGETEPLKQLGINLSVANLEAYRMSQGISTAYNKMSQADQAILRYNYLLSVTADAQGDFARTSGGWANQTRILSLNIETLKSSLGGLAIQALTPVIQKLNQIIEYAIAAANALTKLLGGTVKTSQAASGGMSGLSMSAVQASDDIKDTQKTAQKAAKKIKASFADIDEIHILGNKDDTSAADAAAGAAGAGAQTLTPDFSYAPASTSALDVEGDIEKLRNIGKISGLALMGLGVVLTLLGHPALGIAMIAAGTAIATVSISGGKGVTNKVKSVLGVITSIVGGAMLAVGAILCFTGANVPIGIALLAGGALTLASAETANWSGMNEKTKEVLTIITATLSGAMLAVGAILTLTMTHPALGIALMAAGAAGLATSVALNWGEMSDKTQKALSTITAIVGGALLALGIIVCASNIPLGIAILVAGAASIATSVAVNWNTMSTESGKTLQTIMTVASGALLALGVILCATGAALPLGLGLMAAGGAGLAATMKVDWDMVGNKIKTMWNGIKSWFDGKVKPVFTLEYWRNKFRVIGDALKEVINQKIISHLNNMINKINSFLTISVGKTSAKVLNALGADVSGGKFSIFSIPNIPMLEQGGYVPPNSPQLAIVGDNKREGEITSPESKIREQVELALGRAGGVINDLQALYSIIKQAIKEALIESSFGGDWIIQIVDERGDIKAESIISAVQRKNRRDGKTVIRIGG